MLLYVTDYFTAILNLFFKSCLPLVAGVAHRLHNKHGKNVVLLGDGCQAVRVGGYSHGIVFSAKELKTDELFEVRSEKREKHPAFMCGIIWSCTAPVWFTFSHTTGEDQRGG